MPILLIVILAAILYFGSAKKEEGGYSGCGAIFTAILIVIGAIILISLGFRGLFM